MSGTKPKVITCGSLGVVVECADCYLGVRYGGENQEFCSAREARRWAAEREVEGDIGACGCERDVDACDECRANGWKEVT